MPEIYPPHHRQCRCQNVQLFVKKCELVCVGVKILNFVYFGVKKSGISVFLVSAENGAGVNTYVCSLEFDSFIEFCSIVLDLHKGDRCIAR